MFRPFGSREKEKQGILPMGLKTFFPEKGPHEAGLYFYTVFLSLFSSIHNILQAPSQDF